MGFVKTSLKLQHKDKWVSSKQNVHFTLVLFPIQLFARLHFPLILETAQLLSYWMNDSIIVFLQEAYGSTDPFHSTALLKDSSPTLQMNHRQVNQFIVYCHRKILTSAIVDIYLLLTPHSTYKDPLTPDTTRLN